MSAVTETPAAAMEPPPAAAESSGTAVVWLRAHWHRFALAAILLLSAFLGFWRIGQNGYANEYYSAAVRSMLRSWHNFFFVSFDAGGLVSVDKPPLALWLQAASAKVFGFSGWAILLPEALAGVAAVLVLYLLVRRVFGVVAGLVAALALAVSPVSAAVNRDNNPDALLALLLVLAAWFVVLALERGRLPWVLAAAATVGLAFNTKMLAAGVVVPALGAAYLLFAPVPWRRRLLQLGAAAAVIVVISFAWIAAVDLTPAADRPYVGSTTDNSALSLAFDYNGLGRVAGQTGGTSSGGGMGGAFSGTPGLLRLFNDALGDQGAWLLPLAAIGGLSALLAAWRRRKRLEAGALVALGGWFVTAAAIFSWSSGIIHTYYVSALAPAACGLVGIGAVALWHDARRGRAWTLLPAAALVATAAVQVDLIRRSDYLDGLQWLVLAVTAGACVALAWLALAPAANRGTRRLVATIALAAGIGALLVAPAAWSRTTLLGAVNGVFPGAGPNFISGLGSSSGGGGMGFPGGGGSAGPTGSGAQQGGPGGSFDGGSRPTPPSFGDGSGSQPTPPSFGDGSGSQPTPPSFGGGTRPVGVGGGGGMGNTEGIDEALAYAKANGGERRFTLIVSSAQSAAPSIIAGERTAAMGGFTGRETVLTGSFLADLVSSGDARYFLLGGSGGGPFGSSNAAADAITSTCTLVPTSDWSAGTTDGSGSDGTSGFGGSSASLYDCAGKAAELRDAGPA